MVQKILRRKEVEQATGMRTSTLYDKVAKGCFPKPIKIGPGAVGWLEDEIDAWQKGRAAERL